MDQRIIFTNSGWDFFNTLFESSDCTLEYFATNAQVSVRTVRSWRAGETTAPYSVIEKWSKEFHIPMPDHIIVDVQEQRKRAGSIGGKARMRIHGELGTAEGRSKGGRLSYETHKMNASSPFVAREITYPEKSKELAELVGAALGDGCLTQYQFLLYSNIVDGQAYSEFLAARITMLFGIKPSIIHDPTHGVIRTISSRRELVRYLESLGLVIGNKTKLQACVPGWIEDESEYARACLRGLIDTDGSVYVDGHRIKGKQYQSTCIAFTNASVPLLDFVERWWSTLGYTPTRTKRDVRLRKRLDVLRYAKEVGFSNPKHARKIAL